MVSSDELKAFSASIGRQGDLAQEVLEEVNRARDAPHAAEEAKHGEQISGLSDIAEVAAEGLSDVAAATAQVQKATKEVRDAARQLADTTDEVAGAVLLVDASVKRVDQAVVNLESALTQTLGRVQTGVTDALDEVRAEVGSVTTAVNKMNRATTILMIFSIALAVVAIAVAVMSGR